MVARVNPLDPISRIYAYEIASIPALPHGAADTAVIDCSPPVLKRGFPGKNGFKCAATQMGPTPGPPPP